MKAPVLVFNNQQPPASPKPIIPERLLERLRRLDPEQLQLVEVVVVAIARGAR